MLRIEQHDSGAPAVSEVRLARGDAGVDAGRAGVDDVSSRAVEGTALENPSGRHGAPMA